jgi:hypothetical protein
MGKWIAAAIAAVVVVWLMTSKDRASERQELSVASEEAANRVLLDLARIHRARNPWPDSADFDVMEKSFSIDIEEALKAAGSPIVISAELLDIQRDSTGYYAVFSHDSFSFNAPDVRYVLRISQEHLAFLRDNPGKRYLDSHFIVLLVNNVSKGLARLSGATESDGEVSSGIIEIEDAELFVARGTLIDVRIKPR